MKIGLTNLTAAALNNNLPMPGKKPLGNAQEAISCDQSQTSEKALMLSRNIAALQDQLAPRPDILERFAGFADALFEPDDATLDALLGKMIEA